MGTNLRTAVPTPVPGPVLLLLAGSAVLSGCSDETTRNGGPSDAGSGAGSGVGGTGGSGGAAQGGSGVGGTLIQDAGPPPFTPGNIFIAGSRNAEVFELDPTLQVVSHWTHEEFGTMLPPPGQDFWLGPAGMAFDAKGYLVVAAPTAFCVFSGPNEPVACHDKYAPEPTENMIFDLEGNLYTTTSTGGTDQVRKYDPQYQHLTSFTMPTGQLTGVTCDPDGNLYVASQLGGNQSLIYKVDKVSLTPLDSIPIAGMIEGLQYAQDGNILVGLDGGLGIQLVEPSSPTVVVQTIAHPSLTWAVPITTDDDHNIYVADYENGSGTAPADIFVFDATGKLIASRPASEVYGPFGIVVAGAVLPCGAYQPPR
jgi:YD repeat-containing protein